MTNDCSWKDAERGCYREYGGFRIKAFSETDFTEDLKRFDKPTLVIHGDDDEIVPIGASAHLAAKLIPHATLVVYPGAPDGLADTHKHRLNADLLEFAKS